MSTDTEALKEPVRIATMADELRIVMLAQSLSLPAILHPQGPILGWTLQVMGAPGADDFPIRIIGRSGQPGLSWIGRWFSSGGAGI